MSVFEGLQPSQGQPAKNKKKDYDYVKFIFAVKEVCKNGACVGICFVRVNPNPNVFIDPFLR